MHTLGLQRKEINVSVVGQRSIVKYLPVTRISSKLDYRSWFTLSIHSTNCWKVGEKWIRVGFSLGWSNTTECCMKCLNWKCHQFVTGLHRNMCKFKHRPTISEIEFFAYYLPTEYIHKRPTQITRAWFRQNSAMKCIFCILPVLTYSNSTQYEGLVSQCPTPIPFRYSITFRSRKTARGVANTTCWNANVISKTWFGKYSQSCALLPLSSPALFH